MRKLTPFAPKDNSSSNSATTFARQNIIWYERYFRRENKASWPSVDADIRKLHGEFSRWCEEASSAKVQLIAAESFCKRHQPTLYPLMRAGQGTRALELGIVWAANGTIRHLVIFIHHPEFHFYRYDADVAIARDTGINITAMLADMALEWLYFERRAYHVREAGWSLSHSPKQIRVGLQEAMRLRRIEKRLASRLPGTISQKSSD